MSSSSEPEEAEGLTDGANDVVVVEQPDGTLRATEWHVQIGKFSTFKSLFTSREGRKIEIFANGKKSGVGMTIDEDGDGYFDREMKFRMTPDELKGLHLKKGKNSAHFFVPTLDVEIKFNVYLYGKYEHLIFTDIDGTITKSDARGFVGGTLGLEVHHEGVVRLLDAVGKRGYSVMYLTARSLGFDITTRDYLFKELQNVDGAYSVPDGPLFMSPKTVGETAVEHFSEGPAGQKAHTLASVLALFAGQGAKVVDGAYGNAETDAEAYRHVKIDPSRTWIVNKESILTNVASKAVSSYTYQWEHADELYPRISEHRPTMVREFEGSALSALLRDPATFKS